MKARDRIGRLAAALLAMALLSGMRAAQAQEHTSLALPSITPGFTAIYVAADRGFWKEQGLDVTISQIAGVGTINAVIAGSIDFSGSTAGTLIRAAVAGQRMMAIANLTDRPMDEVVIRKDVAARIGFDPKAPLAQRAEKLKGLRMAVDAINTINHGFLRYVARKGGLDADRDLTVAPMQSPTMAAALAAKSIDGFSVSQPWTTAVIVDGLAVRLASVPGGDFPELIPFGGGIIVTRPQFCKEQRDICLKMGKGIVEGARFMKEHPKETLAILKPRFGTLDEGTLDAAFESYRAATPTSLAVTPAILASSQNFEIETGLTKPADKLASFNGLYSDEFVR
ncbi:MAG TPA: ABC transporter substrate-binding protein [Stellaceae bacterium]|nr:ABC transporter substrate-binding protein [Stellaceae bacterium]